MTKRIGFIGAGAISEVHHEAIKKLKNATFGGFYEPNDALAKKREKEWNVKAYPSLEELLLQMKLILFMFCHQLRRIVNMRFKH